MTPPTQDSQRVVVLGASDKPDRYAYQALQLLREFGHEVVPVHPSIEKIDGIPVVHSLAEVEGPVDTLTVYVNSKASAQLADTIVKLSPGRVIFNPGAESPELTARLDEAGIAYQNACTLVLLNTEQF